MSDKSRRTKRSKIPLYQGRKKNVVSVTESGNCTDSVLKQSLGAKDVDKSECLNLRNISEKPDTDKNEKLIDVGDVKFELDNCALESILNNKGIDSGMQMTASKMAHPSTACNQLSVGRSSLWESLNEYKENLKVYKAAFPQSENNAMRGSDAGVQTSILKYKGTAVTPRSSPYSQFSVGRFSLIESLNDYRENLKVYKAAFPQCEKSKTRDNNSTVQTGILKDRVTAVTPRSSPHTKFPAGNLSLLESLNEFRKNLKVYKAAFPQSENTLQSPRTPMSQQSFNRITPRQRIIGNSMQTASSVTPKNENYQKSWTESKDKKYHFGRSRQPTSFSTSKINGARFDVSEEPNSSFLFSSRKKLCYSTKDVQRPFLPSLCESEETEANIRSSSESVKKGYYNNNSSEESTKADLPSRHLSTLISSPKDKMVPVGRSLTVLNSPLFMSTDVAISRTPSSQSNGINLNSCTKSTWTCQETLCTPFGSGHRSFTNVPMQETHFKTPVRSTFSQDPYWTDSCQLYSAGMQIVHNSLDLVGCRDICERSQDANNKLTLPLVSSSADLNKCFNRLALTSSPIMSQCSRMYPSTPQNQFYSVSELMQQKIMPHLNTQMSSSPVSILSAKVTIPCVSRVLTSSQNLPATPSAQKSVFNKYSMSEITPQSYYLNRPPMRVLKGSSCLESKENIIINSSTVMPIRNTVSSAKKLRWADMQDQSNNLDD